MENPLDPRWKRVEFPLDSQERRMRILLESRGEIEEDAAAGRALISLRNGLSYHGAMFRVRDATRRTFLDTTFIDELASAAPTPGGGGASAYVGAVASALASMVGNLTRGKKTYAAVEDEVQDALRDLEGVRGKLLALIESDARAFEPLAASYRMPKATPEEAAAKRAALQLALGPACDVPLAIMRACAEVIDYADFLARNGSKLAVSDAGAAAVLARAALVAASMNVYINAASMDDENRADGYRTEADALIAEANVRADGILAYTMDAIR